MLIYNSVSHGGGAPAWINLCHLHTMVSKVALGYQLLANKVGEQIENG